MSAHEQPGGPNEVEREEVYITGEYGPLDNEAKLYYASVLGRTARRALERMAESSDAAWDAGLVAAEAITNAFVHGGGLSWMRLVRTEANGAAQLEVTTANPAQAIEGAPMMDSLHSAGFGNSEAEHGRGGLVLDGVSNWQQINEVADGERRLRTTAIIPDTPRSPRPNGHPPDSINEAA